MAYTRGIWKRATAGSLFVALTLAASGPLATEALPPPLGRYSHGAAGTARNGFGGEIAGSATGNSWPGTGANNNGGPFAFAGAQYGSLWNIPAATNNSRGVGYCVMEDVAGEGVVTMRPDPAVWSAGESARAAALMATFGGDRVVPYGISDAGTLNVSTGEWENPLLFGSGEFTRRRQVAVNFGVRMFLADLSPQGVAGGRKLARDTSVINGAGGEFAALRSGYQVAQYMARVADRQSAVGGVTLQLVWGTSDGTQPTKPGTYPLEVRVTDGSGKRVGLVPVLQLSGKGIGDNRSANAIARVNNDSDAPADLARWSAAAAAGWPVWGMNHLLAGDPRFTVATNVNSADVADGDGVSRFNVEITASEWELAFHVQAPTANVDLYAGSGIQGQVTWSGRPQAASVHEQFVAPDKFVTVRKTSNDPTIPVTGTVFGLYDGSGDEVDKATVDANGAAAFDGFSPATFEPPYVLRELSAAPGLDRIDTDIALPAIELLSTDEAKPTDINIINTATLGRFRVRKILDDADVQGSRDMSGFEFQITRVATELTLGKFTTDTKGLTSFTDAALGDYKISEISRPAWAEPLTDAGPITFKFDPTAGDAEITYENRVPEASIKTRASDPTDGDKFVELGANGTNQPSEVLDVVSYCDLVPGTQYRIRGSIQVFGDDGATVPSGVVSDLAFVPMTSCGDLEVLFEIPPGSEMLGQTAVIFEQLILAATEAVVAEHADPNDVAQQVFFPALSTEMIVAVQASEGERDSDDPSSPMAQHIAAAGDQIMDVVAYAGLAPNTPYRAELALFERDSDGNCLPTGLFGSQDFTTTEPSGTVTVAGIRIPDSGVYVGYERIYAISNGDDGDDLLVAAHEDCDDRAQTVWAPGMDTAVAETVVVGSGTMIDKITVAGIADGVANDATVVIEGALYRHDQSDRSQRTCGLANQVAEFVIDVAAAGEYRSPGEDHETGWYSYSNRFVVTFADGTTWESERYGCQVQAESFEAKTRRELPPTSTPSATITSAPAVPTTTTTSPSTTSPSTAPRPPTLPRTGGTGSSPAQLIAILLVLAGGALFLATPALPLQGRRWRRRR